MDYKEWDNGINSRSKILKEMQKRPLTAKMVAKILGIKRESAYYYLTKLSYEGEIGKKTKDREVWYGIPKSKREKI